MLGLLQSTSKKMCHHGFTLPLIPSGKEITFFPYFAAGGAECVHLRLHLSPLSLVILFGSPRISGFFTVGSGRILEHEGASLWLSPFLQGRADLTGNRGGCYPTHELSIHDASQGSCGYINLGSQLLLH